MNQKYYRQGAGNGNSVGFKPTRMLMLSLAPLRKTITLPGVENRLQYSLPLFLLLSLQSKLNRRLNSAHPPCDVQPC
jgi:hypothetical protein